MIETLGTKQLLIIIHTLITTLEENDYRRLSYDSETHAGYIVSDIVLAFVINLLTQIETNEVSNAQRR